MLIGVVADSHVGEFLTRMPDAALEALEGCDLLLHAGDLSVPAVLDELGSFAPVLAVRGDHDRLDGLGLPETLVVTAGGHRIGVVHGNRHRLVDGAMVAADVVAGRALGWTAGLDAALTRRLGPVDLVVHGHWHRHRLRRVGTTIVWSPGAVCPWGNLEGRKRPRPGALGVVDRGVRRYRHQLGPDALRPAVGVIEVGSAGVRPRRVQLPWESTAPVVVA